MVDGTGFNTVTLQSEGAVCSRVTMRTRQTFINWNGLKFCLLPRGNPDPPLLL
jgi:hypothetical protein